MVGCLSVWRPLTSPGHSRPTASRRPRLQQQQHHTTQGALSCCRRAAIDHSVLLIAAWPACLLSVCRTVIDCVCNVRHLRPGRTGVHLRHHTVSQ